jgi:hypothetical protein
MHVRLAVVLDRDPAVDQDVAVAAGALDAPPLAAREVVCDLGGEARELLVIVDDDVGGRALDERAAPSEPRAVRRERREAPVRVLERAHRLLAHDGGEELGRVAAAGEELRVRAAVGDAGEYPWMRHDVAHRLAAHVRRLGVEDRAQVVGHRDVEHDVDRVLAGPRRHLADRQVLERPRLVAEALDDLDVRDADRDDARLVRAERGTARRVGELLLALLDRTQRGVQPVRVVVEEVPVLEREGERGGRRDALPVHAHAALAARVEPRDLHPVRVGITHEALHDVVEERPAAHLRQLLHVYEVVRAVGRRERHLHEALVALREHPRQLERRLVVHDVGHHRAAVVVALHGARAVGMEPLRRPAAAAGVHRLVEEPADLAVLGVRGQLAGLGALEAEHPDEERRDGHVREYVDGLRPAVDAVQELGVRHPVPGEALRHRHIRDRLDARHREHRALAQLRAHRREAEAAVADDDGRDAVPPRERQVRVPEELRVVVRVQVDEPGGDDHPARVERLRGVRGLQAADPGDAAVADADVGAVALGPRAVDHQAILQDDVQLGHPESPTAPPSSP